MAKPSFTPNLTRKTNLHQKDYLKIKKNIMDKEEEERLIKAYERKLWGDDENEEKEDDEDPDSNNLKTPSKTPAKSPTPNKKPSGSPNFKSIAANAPANSFKPKASPLS